MNKYKVLSIVLSVVSVVSIGGMLYFALGNTKEEPKSKEVTTTTTETTTTTSTKEESTTEIQTTITTIGEVNQQVVRDDYPGYALIPKLTPNQPVPITYANLQGAIPGDGWLYQVRLVIEEHLGKSLDNATNKEIERAILEISSRNGFENAVKTPVTIP